MKIKTIQNNPEKKEAMQRRLANYQNLFQKRTPCPDNSSSSKKGDRL